MAKTDGNTKNQNNKQGDGSGQKKGGGGKSGKKEEKKEEYKPGMSYLYEPCPHRVWTPKPGERDKSEPRGVGSPWYEPVRKKEDIDKEEAEKSKKKEEKAQQKRQKGYSEKQKQKEEEEKKKKEEDQKKEEKQKQKEEKKKQKEKEKKKKENEKRKKQEEQRKRDKEEKKKEEEEKKKEEEENKGKRKGKEKGKEKEKPQASYMYEPCPHRVYTPGPGEKDMADPKGVGSPWYVPVRKKEDIDKEEDERREQELQKTKDECKKRQKEKKEKQKREEEELKEAEERFNQEEKRVKARKDRIRKEKERRRRERENEEIDHDEIGCGVRKSRTDFTPELIFMMDFITDVDEKERERRGEALRWKKEEIEEEIESHLAKEAFTKDFKEFTNTFIQAELMRADKKLMKMEKDERIKRRKLLKNMDPLAKDLMAEGKRFKKLYKAATGERGKGSGEGSPSAMEDMMVSMIMGQMDKMSTSPTESCFLDMFKISK